MIEFIISNCIDYIFIVLMEFSCYSFNHVTDKKYIISADFLIWEINICHRTSLPSKYRVFKASSVQKAIWCVGYLNLTSSQKATLEIFPDI